MANILIGFEDIVRRANQFTLAKSELIENIHPFDERNVHPKLPKNVRKLFDDGHYAQASFEAFKFVDKQVAKHAQLKKSGTNLMEEAFTPKAPKISLNALSNQSEIDEQSGFQRLFSGATLGIRNPRGHECDIHDTLDQCLDHLSLASLLLRRLDDAGYKIS
jgi:uncharacterized protein (TIGR02391 family)